MEYIYIFDENNKKKKMKVVTIFKLENKDFNYIIYRELDGSKTYMAKYKENIEELNTDITEEELKLGEEIISRLIK